MKSLRAAMALMYSPNVMNRGAFQRSHSQPARPTWSGCKCVATTRVTGLPFRHSPKIFSHKSRVACVLMPVSTMVQPSFSSTSHRLMWLSWKGSGMRSQKMPGATFLMVPGSGTSPQGKRSCANRRCDRSGESGMAEISAVCRLLSRPWNDRPPCDIAPAKALGPVDQVHSAIRPLARFLHGGRHRRHIQHAAAICQDARAVGLGAGMEDLHTLDPGGRVEAADLAAARIGVGIAL